MPKYIHPILLVWILIACAPALTAPLPDTPTQTLISAPAFTDTPAATETPAQEVFSFCDDTRPKNLIENLAAAFKKRDGSLLAASISPNKGVDILFYRDGSAVHYTPEEAGSIFESDLSVDWGLSFGSGEATLGSFKDVVLPSLQFVFSNISTMSCNELLHGGATYIPEWPYPNMDFYSLHYAGTDQYGALDWQTWAVGMHMLVGQAYVAALVHYVWEP